MSIVRVVAFQGSTSHATAYRSDAVVEPVNLVENSLAPGTYTYEFDPAATLSYKGPPGFRFVRKDEYVWASHVEVRILPASSPDDQLDQFELLTPHLRAALLERESEPGTYEDTQQWFEAGLILLAADFSPEDLLMFGRPVAGASVEDPVAWANELLERRQRALVNRLDFFSAAATLGTLEAADRDRLVRQIAFANSGEFGSVAARHAVALLRDRNIAYDALVASFNEELQRVTHAFLSKSEVLVDHVERLYLAGEEPERQRDALNQVVSSLSTVHADVNAAAKAVEERVSELNNYVTAFRNERVTPPPETVASLEATVTTAKRRLNIAQSRYQLLTKAFLPLAGAEGFSLERLASARTGRGRQIELRQFVSVVRRRLKRARRLVSEDVRNLYAADRMVALAKDSLGVQGGSLLDQVVSLGVLTKRAERTFWEELFDVVTALADFLPGRVQVVLQVLNLSRTADELSRVDLLHTTELSAQSPSDVLKQLARDYALQRGLSVTYGFALRRLPHAGVSVPEGGDVGSTGAAPRQPAETARTRRSKKVGAPEGLDPKQADVLEVLLGTVGERRRMAARGGLVDQEFHDFPEQQPPFQRRGERVPGRTQFSSKEAAARIKKALRTKAREGSGKKLQAALDDPARGDALTLAAIEYLTDDELDFVYRTGKLPDTVEFHHLLTVADFPEFAGLAESGVALPRTIHRQAGHAMDPTRPIEAATLLDPAATTRPGVHLDPEFKTRYRPKHEAIAEGAAITRKIDRDILITQRRALKQLERKAARKRGTPDAALQRRIERLREALKELEQLIEGR